MPLSIDAKLNGHGFYFAEGGLGLSGGTVILGLGPFQPMFTTEEADIVASNIADKQSVLDER
jgi:hypothetical protein